MNAIAESMLSVFDFAWDRLRGRLEGIDDDEYFWEPVLGSWSLRRDDSGDWQLDGGGGGGPAPDPAPMTTIAWRTGHLGALALGGFTARRFPEAAGEEPLLPVHGADAVAFLERGYRGWRRGMQSLEESAWWEPLGPDWGPYSDDSTLDLVLHVLDELVHHGAEISLLRDLYLHREVGESDGG
jgi:hypothetical protein